MVQALLALLLTVTPTPTSLIWDGDPAGGTDIFRTLECPDPGSIEAVEDASRGTVWRFDKAIGIDRCEARSIRVDGSAYEFQNGRTYYIGWTGRSADVEPDHVVFQWKSYPNGEQNYPALITVKGGEVRLFHITTDGTWQKIWSAPIEAEAWHSFAIGIHTSDDAASGWIELYHNGEQQAFTDGSKRYAARTWDGTNEPKWGAYDRGVTDVRETTYIDGLRIGTTYADVEQ